MAGSAGSIFVDLLLRDAQYVQGLNRARQQTRQATNQFQGDLAKTRKAFQSVISPVNNLSFAVASLGGVVASALSVQQIVRYSDTWRQLEGRLLIVEGSMMGVRDAQQGLLDISQRTRQSLEGVTSFYTRLTQFIPEAERAQYDLLGVTESVATALAITGETSESATGAMIQFTQAIGTNFEAAGQELRSLQEQAPRLTQALMRALGDGTKSLQQLKDEGLLTRESVLNALSGMGEEGRKMAEELAKVPLTVGQAFTRLNNAFLQFIGTNRTVGSTTTALANAISLLANNLDLVTKAAVALSIVMTTRVIASFGAAQIQAIAYQLTLARMAGVSAVAATSLLGLSTAARAASVAFTAIGGWPVIITAAATSLILFKDEIKLTRDGIVTLGGAASIVFSDISKLIQKITFDIDKFFNKSNKRMDELANHKLMRKMLAGEPLMGRNSYIDSVFDRVRIQKEADEVSKIIQQQVRLIDRTRTQMQGIASGKGGDFFSMTGISKGGTNKKETSEEEQKNLEQLYQRNRDIILGLDRATLAYQDTVADLNKLLQAGRISQDDYNSALMRAQDELDKTRDKVNDFGVDAEQFSKRAAENIQDAFADFLFDPFEKGVKGMAKGFIDSVRRMIAEAQAAQLAKYLFGGSAGGEGTGILGDALGSLVGGIFGSGGGDNPAVSATPPKPSFFAADGGVFGPNQWGVVGEDGPEMLYTGQTGATIIPNKSDSGGNRYVFNIGTEVNQRDIRRIEQMVLATAGPGQVERRVSTGFARGEI